MPNRAQHASGAVTYRMLRELGARAQPSFAAIREPSDLVVAQRFVRARAGDAAHGEHAGTTTLDAESLALLLRDARCLAKNWHPNVARVRHVDLSAGAELTIATDLIDGATLDDLVSAAAPERTSPRDPLFALPMLVRILLDVLAGLHALHALRDGMNAPLGAIHGALCPANVVVGRDGVARIINVLRKRPVRIAEGSEAVGYAAPEALDGPGTDDPRADVYAVGVMLWEGLAGRRLYNETDPARVLSRQREGELVTPAIHPSSPFERLADTAMRALAFDPALRFKSAAEMAAELRKIAGARLATGSALAARVGDLAGDRIRDRRGALDPAISGTRRKASGRAIQAAEQAERERAVTTTNESELENAIANEIDEGARVAVPSLPPLPPPVVTSMVRASPRRAVRTVEASTPDALIEASRPSTNDTAPYAALSEEDLLDEDLLDDDDELPGPRGSSPEIDLDTALALSRSSSPPASPPVVSPKTPNLPFPVAPPRRGPLPTPTPPAMRTMPVQHASPARYAVPAHYAVPADVAVPAPHAARAQQELPPHGDVVPHELPEPHDLAAPLPAPGTPSDFVLPIDVTETVDEPSDDTGSFDDTLAQMSPQRQARILAGVALVAAVILFAMGAFVAFRPGAALEHSRATAIAAPPPQPPQPPVPAVEAVPPPSVEPAAIATASAAGASVAPSAAPSAGPSAKPAIVQPRAGRVQPVPAAAPSAKPKKSIYDPDDL